MDAEIPASPAKIKAYWWDKFDNLGDALTRLLLEHFGFDPVRSEPGEAEVCVVGSVLELLGPDFAGAVIGAGFLSEGPPCAMPHARILALRGPLSAARAGVKPLALGDAGLLCPWLAPQPRRAQIRVGIVPHYKDKDDRAVRQIADRLSDVRVIDVQGDPVHVLGEIAECETILSSSLHGLIAAEAFGRRTGWLVLSDAVLGRGFKFRDHYASIGAAAAPKTLCGEEDMEGLEALATYKGFDLSSRQTGLAACFEQLRRTRRSD